jgi:mono/diheme cytochrome c family protein
MSTPSQPDPRLDQAAVTDDSLLVAHEKLLGKQPDEKARYRLLPLNLLFIFSGLIFFGGTYLGRYAGHFSPQVYNENALPPKAGAPVVAAPVDPLVLGKTVYGAVCIACHQATGLGQAPIFPPLVGSEWVTGSEERIIRIVLHGLQGPIKVKGTDFMGAMPATGPGSGYNLSPEKVAAVITYVRHEFGNGAPPVSTEKVAEIRAKEGNRAMWTVAELEKLP